jgi:hypothetical protein
MKGLQRSLSRASAARKDTNVARLVVTAALTFTGASGVAVFATSALAGLPEGNILLLGAVANMTFTGPTSANLANDFQGDFSLGTTPADDATLSGTDVDLIASTAIPAATAEVSAGVRATNATQAVIDNTDGTAEMNLNVLLDADEVTDGESVVITVTGTVDVAYIVLGDD